MMALGADLSESESDGCWDVQYLEGDIFFVCTVLCRQLEFSSEVQADKQLPSGDSAGAQVHSGGDAGAHCAAAVAAAGPVSCGRTSS